MGINKVESKQVVRIYSQAMAEAKSGGLSGIPQIEEAFRILQKVRQKPGMSTDLNLAAAEWFAFARFSVATGFVGKAQMMALSYGYWIKKLYDKKFGDPNAEAVTSNPVSEPNEDVANWGMAGASQGETDHAAYAIATTPPFWRSVDSIMGENKGGYRSIGHAT
jgi:hypothetical protein